MSKPYPDVESWLKNNTPSGRGMCLNTSMRAYGAHGMGASDATEAVGKTKDLQKGYTSSPPAGAHVLYTGGSQGHGHSCVSDGDGYVYTVDWYSGLNITRVKKSDMESAWGNLKWAGWSKYYGDQPLDIPGGSTPPPKPPAPEDDVPDYLSKTTSTDMSTSKATWKTIKLSDDGDISLAFGAVYFDALVQITLSGLPDGKAADVRFYQCDTKSGETTKRVSSYRKQRIIASGGSGTGGATQLGQLKAAASGWQRRLRAEIYTEYSGVVVTSAEGRAFTWK